MSATKFAELEPLDLSATSGHAMVFCTSVLAGVYEYDPTDDGPEIGVITRIRARHVLYAPGKEGELLRFQHFVDAMARKMYGKHFGRLGKKRQENVQREVIAAHLGDNFKGTAYWTLGRLYA